MAPSAGLYLVGVDYGSADQASTDQASTDHGPHHMADREVEPDIRRNDP
jgi:hypothetical protein